jgi:hypothetical protein
MTKTTKRAQALGYFIGEIKRNVASDPVVVKDNIESFNALTLPHFYVYVSNDLVHVVKLFSEDFEETQLKVPGTPIMVSHTADVIWHFNYITGIWNTIKDRLGIYQSLCPIKCGGPIKSLSVPVQR